jgi:serine/threonine-protein kinase
LSLFGKADCIVLDSDQILANRYRLILLVGQGTMGAVYDAEDLVFNRRVALKRLRYAPEASERVIEQTRAQFEREAKILASLRHPSLPRVTDYFSFSDQEFLVMDYIDGQSLDELMALQPGGQDEAIVLDWADQLLSALEYIHQHGLVHRDIKPANIRVTPDSQIFLVDFGLVRVFDPASPKTATAVRGLGTPQYAPPEQYDAELGHTEPRSDLYALGATLYHLLTGEPPATVTRRVSNPGAFRTLREINPEISPEVERVVLRAMEVSIARRFASANDMRSAFKMASIQHPVSPVDTSQLPAAELMRMHRRNRRRRVVGTAAGLVVMLGVCASVFVAARPGLPPATSTPTPIDTATRVVPAALATSSVTDTPTATLVPATHTATRTRTGTATRTRTATPTATPTATLRRFTSTFTSTPAISPTFTNTPERPGLRPATNTPTPAPPTPQPTNTFTPVPPPSDTPGPTEVPTLGPSPTSSSPPEG